MQFPQMLLVITFLTTVVSSFPTTTEHENNTDISKIAKSISESTENRKPLVIVVEENNPNSGSLVLEIVYNGNSIADSNVSDKDKYVVDYKSQEKNSKETNFKKKDAIKHSQNSNTKQENPAQNRKPAPTFKVAETMKATSLISKEVSPLLEKWPKYFYDAFNPIQPFPELQNKNLERIQEIKAQSETFDAHKFVSEKEQKKSQDTAGPQINPISIYDREFRRPIFD